MALITIFYDGTCPLCVKEMQALRKRDSSNNIETVDIYSDDFVGFPQIDPVAANRILHAIKEDGTLLLGLDAAYEAWRLLGRGWLYAPLRWRFVKPIADKIYLYFADNRYRISWYLTGKRRLNNQCESGTCNSKPRESGAKQ